MQHQFVPGSARRTGLIVDVHFPSPEACEAVSNKVLVEAIQTAFGDAFWACQETAELTLKVAQMTVLQAQTALSLGQLHYPVGARFANYWPLSTVYCLLDPCMSFARITHL